MDKKLAGLIGAVGALAATAPSQAAVPGIEEVMRAESYADLLRPIPHATALLQESDAAVAAQPEVLSVQYYHHHHHHHHRYYRPRYYGPVLVPPRYVRRHYHHHHHHHGFGVIIR